MVARISNTIICFCLLVLMPACHKKSLPVEADQNPVFYLRGDLNGSPINLEAGNDDYYMNSSYEWDTTKVCIFKGDLRQKICNGNCKGYAITVLLNDAKKSEQSSNVDMNDVLKIGKYEFNDLDLQSLFYKVTLLPEKANSDSASYIWTFNNGIDNSFEIRNYSPVVNLKTNQHYSITLNYADGMSCTAIHENLFKIGCNVQSTITAVRNASVFSAALYDFSCQCKGTAPFQYLWDFGDGTTSNLAAPNHSFPIILFGKSRIKLQLIDANKDTCISYYQVQTSGDPTCDANYFTDFKALPNTKAFSSITILITDPNGIVYSTKNLAQPVTSYFEVIDISDYLNNSENNPTKKVKLKLNCVLNNGNNQIQLKNAEVSLAFAYKN